MSPEPRLLRDLIVLRVENSNIANRINLITTEGAEVGDFVIWFPPWFMKCLGLIFVGKVG
ncbi:MAG: hypothetical protein ACI92G_001881 [Candidatus Pelagisphaera sp.]|jgi:hypothetical protein